MNTACRAMVGAFLLLMSLVARGEKPTPAPDFTLPFLEGTGQISLHDYHGRYVLVDFWASWCSPCRESLPEYNVIRAEVRKAFGEKAFEILAINVDITAEEGRAFIEQVHPTYPVLRENTGATQRAYQLIGMPTAFMIDPEGNIAFYYNGYSARHAALLRQNLYRLLDPSGKMQPLPETRDSP